MTLSFWSYLWVESFFPFLDCDMSSAYWYEAEQSDIMLLQPSRIHKPQEEKLSKGKAWLQSVFLFLSPSDKPLIQCFALAKG